MSYEPTGEWVPYPDVNTVCVIHIGNFAVDEHNKNTGDDLKFDRVIWGAYNEINDDTLKHDVFLEATNGKGDTNTYQAKVLVEYVDGKKEEKLISFNLAYKDPEGRIWKKIPDYGESCVQDVAEFAVDEHNNGGDNLVYQSVVDGWYREVKPNAIQYDLYIKAKDCFGRERIYRAIVLEEEPLTKKIRTLEYFKITPRKC